MKVSMDDLDRRLVKATQGGLPLVPQPYAQLAAQLGIGEAEVIDRLAAMLERGAIRRIGAVPNHYAIGYRANGMSVWDIPDERVDAVGEFLGRQAAVTHCYRRPRRLPDWPYNLFAMVHGHHRDDVLAQLDALEKAVIDEFGPVVRARDVLFSTRILKKTGIRLGEGEKAKSGAHGNGKADVPEGDKTIAKINTKANATPNPTENSAAPARTGA